MPLHNQIHIVQAKSNGQRGLCHLSKMLYIAPWWTIQRLPLAVNLYGPGVSSIRRYLIWLFLPITIKCTARGRFDPCVDGVSRSDHSIRDNKYRFSWSFSTDAQVSPHCLRTNCAFSETYGKYSNYPKHSETWSPFWK